MFQFRLAEVRMVACSIPCVHPLLSPTPFNRIRLPMRRILDRMEDCEDQTNRLRQCLTTEATAAGLDVA